MKLRRKKSGRLTRTMLKRKKSGRSTKNLIITVIFISSFVLSILFLIGLYFFWKAGLLYVGITLIVIFFGIFLVSACLFFSRPKEVSDRFFSRFEKKEEIRENEEGEKFEADKPEYSQIKEFFKKEEREQELKPIQKETPSVKDVIEFLEDKETITITEITDYFYPRENKSDKKIINNLSYKTKLKSWPDYSTIKRVLEILMAEKKISGSLKIIGRELYYLNPKSKGS
jgi:hypothetical protein